MRAIEAAAVIGVDHVGKNIIRRIAPIVDVVAYDVAWGVPYPAEELARCDIAIVCVPTPSLPTRACDTTVVEKVIADLPVDLVWIRSTVPPGTSDELAERYGKRICFSREYVGETSLNDAYDLEVPSVPSGMPNHGEARQTSHCGGVGALANAPVAGARSAQ